MSSTMAKITDYSNVFSRSIVCKCCSMCSEHRREPEMCKSSCIKLRQNVNNSTSRQHYAIVALSILVLTANHASALTSSTSTGSELTSTVISPRFNTTNELPTKLTSSGRASLYAVSSTTPFSTAASPTTTTTTTTTSKSSTSTVESQSATNSRERRVNPVSLKNSDESINDNGQTTSFNDLVASPSSVSSTTVRFNAPSSTYSTTEYPSSVQTATTVRNSDTQPSSSSSTSAFSNRRLLASSRASDASDWSTPASSSSLLAGQSNTRGSIIGDSSSSSSSGSNNGNNYSSDQPQTQRRRQNTANEQVESQSTSQLSRFARPTVSAAPSQSRQNTRPDKQSSQQQTQQYRSQKSAASGSNKWTHFGARLKPLPGTSAKSSNPQQVAQTSATGSENHLGAASSSSPSAIVSGLAQARGTPGSMIASDEHKILMPNGAAMTPVIGNSVAGNDNGNGANDDNDDDDDDLDSEALLYKMMQQQHFLMNPNMADQPTNVAGANAYNSNSNSARGQVSQSSLATNARRDGSVRADNNGDAEGSSTSATSSDIPANSKKVIKLLKSYSHIHQVDDSDDQIRGTYTRVSARRPQSSASEPKANYRPQRPRQTQPQLQQQSGRQSISSGATGSTRTQHNGRHIYVSSKPVVQASSTQRATNRRPVAINQQLSPSPTLVSSGGGGGGGDGNLVDNDSDDDSVSDANQVGSSSGSLGSDGASGLAAAAAAQSGPTSDEEEFECPNNGIFADVASGCQAYHVCQSGAQVQQRFQCPLGTLFNDIILTCDFAHNVQCNGQARPMVQAWPDQTGAADETRPPAPPAPLGQSRPQASAPTQVRRPSHQSPPVARNPSNPRPATNGGWSPAAQVRPAPVGAQTGGPRQLLIGSQYNRHNSQPAAQSAVAGGGVYPPPPSSLQRPSGALSAASSTESAPLLGTGTTLVGEPSADETDSDDNEPNEPLVAATLPPAAPASSARPQSMLAPSLPFRAPPQPNYGQPQVIYGSSGGGGGAALAYGDGASATAPTRAADHAASGQAQAAASSNKLNKDDAQSFNLVINHVSSSTPTHRQRQQPQQPTRPSPANGRSGGLAQQAHLPQPLLQQQQQPKSYSTAPKHTAPVVTSPKSAAQNSAVFVSEQALANPFLPIGSPPKQYQRQTQPARAASNRQLSSSSLSSSPASKQPRRASQQPAQQALQPAQQHYEANQSAQRPTLVDLNNPKQAQGVSSDALNDGLLLIVRHSSGANPLQLASSSAATSLAKPRATAPYGANDAYEPKSVAGRRSPKADASAAAAAYVVDPTLVNASSQLDAQLFPNVQRFVADTQLQQVSSHEAGRPSAVAGPLRPMEPPQAPAHSEGRNSDGDHLQTAYATARTAVSSATPTAASSGQQSASPKEVSQAEAQQQQQTIKRTRRLKAAPMPPAKPASKSADDDRVATNPKTADERSQSAQVNQKASQARTSAESRAAPLLRPAANKSQQ